MILAGDEPIYIHRRTASSVDAYGNPSYETEAILVRNALIGYSGSSEPREANRNPIDARLTVYLPHGVTVAEGDVFEIRDTFWEKDGDPQEWDTVNGFEVGVVVQVKRRRG